MCKVLCNKVLYLRLGRVREACGGVQALIDYLSYFTVPRVDPKRFQKKIGLEALHI